MAEATKKLEQASHMMENVQNLCVQLFATGTSEAGYSLKNTLANLVTLHAKVKHEAEHWCSHLADTHNKLAMFESYEKEITNFLDETNVQATELIKHSSGEEKDLEKVQQLLHNLLDKLKGIKLLQSSLLEKEPKYLETVSCGEMLLVNCCFDTTVIAAKLESLKEKWKTTLHDFSDCECKVEQHKNQLDKKQQALSKLKDWIVSCHVYMYDMNSTMESDVVTSDINALEQFLEEGNNIQVDPTFEPFLLSEFSLPVPQQTGEEPKKTSFHKTKEKVSERKINLTELVLDIKQLFDMFNTFRSLLDMLMTQLSEWENQMNPPIEKLRETLEAYKKWKDKVSSCTTEYSDLQSTTAALQRKHAERINFDSVKDEFNVLNARWNDLLQSSSKCLQDLLKKCNAYEQYCDKHQRSVEWLQDKRTIFSMLNVSCTELSVYSKQHAQIEALLDDVVNRESHLEECSQFVEILPQLKEKFDLIWTDWNSLKEDLVALSFQQSESLKKIKALFIVLEELQSWSETVCSKIAQTEIQCNRIWLKYENETFSSHESFNFGEGEKKYTEVFETADNLLKSNVLSNSLHSDIMTKANFANNSASQAYDNYGEIVSKTKTTFEEIALSCKSIKDALKIVSSQLSSFGHVPVVRKDIEAKLQQLQDLQKDVDNNKILQKKIENMFEQVRKFCRCEKHPNLITETENIFNVVQGDINQLKENLLSQTNSVLKFEEMAKDTENRLNGIETHIKLTKEMSGLTAKQIKFAKKEISEAAEDLQSAENLVDNLDPISRNKEQMAAQKESSLSVLKNVTALKHTIQDLDDRYMSYSDSDFGVSNHERDVSV
uniref:Plectin n=1 Tax=Phallusia mammillata TaxID=59560 RepID=A0A6F9DNC6_9ASCI|nr:plectin [Phallusia mammillata]